MFRRGNKLYTSYCDVSGQLQVCLVLRVLSCSISNEMMLIVSKSRAINKKLKLNFLCVPSVVELLLLQR